VRGKVWHPDHRTIYLDGWHKVLRNTESEPKNVMEDPRQAELRGRMFQMDFVD
jgi:hypothetical protein